MQKVIIDENQFFRTISRISHEIIEKHRILDDVVIVGIRRRGAEIATLLRQKIKHLTNIDLPAMELDITFYRDDLSYTQNGDSPTYNGASTPVDIQGKKVILVDDVLFTGRTIRAALDALVDFGRAAKIELVILIDRGHRELPIRADYVGKNIPTARQERIAVKTMMFDGCYQVLLSTA